MIKAVVFDFFGVIFSDDYWNIVGHDKQLEGSHFHQLADEVNAGTIHWQEFVNEVATATGKSVAFVEEMYHNERLDTRLVGYIRHLKQSYKTGLLSNAHYEFIDPLLTQTHLGSLFDAVTISSRVGASKPDARIYHAALEQLDVRPHETVFIDDVARNVDGAEAVGITGILYQDVEQLKEALEPLLGNTDN